MITLKQIADECNVSMATVSNVLNGRKKMSEVTRSRVLEVIHKYGYRPNAFAQSLRRQSAKTIGIVEEDIAQFSTPPIIEGIMLECEKYGYRTVGMNMRMYSRWSDTWYDDAGKIHSVLDPILEEFLAMRVDGIIYIAGHARIMHCFPQDFPIPAVMTYAYEQNKKIPSIVIDDKTSSQEMMRYLLAKGHRQIGVIGGVPNNMHTQDRLIGVQRALFEAKVPYDPDLIRFGDFEPHTGYENCEYLMREKGVSAIFCMTDRIASGVFRYLFDHGLKAGKDLAIAGYDGQELSGFLCPLLTTARLPLLEIGTKSAEMLHRMISGEEDKEHVYEPVEIKCEFLQGESA